MIDFPQNRILRNYREIDPVTGRYKHPMLIERWAYRLQDWCRRLARKLNWLKETGEWPVLCSNPSCIHVVVPGGGQCLAHSSIMPFGVIKTTFDDFPLTGVPQDSTHFAIRASGGGLVSPVIMMERNIQVNMLGDHYVDTRNVIRAITAVLSEMSRFDGRCDQLQVTAKAGPYGLVTVTVSNQ